jgi:nicotinate-nucleotide adenylyltransferase
MITPHLRNGACFSGMKIGLLGGSFNPAHDGHRAISLYALKQLGLNQIWWLVSPQNPLKSTIDMAALDKRMRQAAHIAMHPHIAVTSIESQLGTRYTVDTLRALKRRFPRAHFVWLMGTENLQQVPRWKKWKDIFCMVPVAVFRRPDYACGHGLGKAAIRFGKARHPATAGKNLTRQSLPAWAILDNKFDYHSASKIRKDNPSWRL